MLENPTDFWEKIRFVGKKIRLEGKNSIFWKKKKINLILKENLEKIQILTQKKIWEKSDFFEKNEEYLFITIFFWIG
jgi:hypothetical protein